MRIYIDRLKINIILVHQILLVFIMEMMILECSLVGLKKNIWKEWKIVYLV